METNNNYKYLKYNDYWQNSLQRLEGITKNLEQNFNILERQYFNFDRFYSEIITEIDILAAIYSSHNNLKGKEYILKLKALLNHYRKKYSHEGIDFKIIHFLNTKINSLRDISIEQFPKMEHTYYVAEDISDEESRTAPDIKRYNELKNSSKYKWITFQRNGSWFISRYGKFQIIRKEEADRTDATGPKIKIKYKDTIFPVTDIFARFRSNKKEQIKLFIILKSRNSLKCYAANRAGKVIMADNDFITPRLTAFEKSKIYSGRIRIFGKNHIYL